MALNGSFTGSIKNGWYTIRIDWTAEQNVINNTSKITCKLYFCNKYSLSISNRTHTITIDNTSYSLSSSAINTTGTHYIGSCTKTINHDSDGAKSINISCIFNLKATLSGTYYSTISANKTIELDTIPRSSIFSLIDNNCIVGNKLTIQTQAYSSNFYNKIKIYIDDKSYISDAKTGSITYDFSYTIPLDWANSSALINSKSTTGTIQLMTYSDSTCKTQIGSTQTKTFTLSINIDSNYTNDFILSIQSLSIISNDSSITYNNYIKNKTKCKFNGIVVQGSSGATIKTISIKDNNGYNSGSLTYVDNMSHITSTLINAGNIVYTITATDSRGVTKSITKTINVLDYTLPKFNIVTTSRVTKLEDNTYIDSDEGNCIKTNIAFSYFEIDNNITSLLISFYKSNVYYQKEFSFDKNNLILLDKTENKMYIGAVENNVYYFTVYWDAELDLDESYPILYSLTDSYNTVTYNDVLSTAYFIMDIAPGGKSIAFGKSADDTYEGLEIAMNTKLIYPNTTFEFNNNGFYINGSLFTGSGGSGSTSSGDYYTKNEIDNMIGNISTMLYEINGTDVN